VPSRAPCSVEPSQRGSVLARHYHLFQPLLYQVAMAVLSPGDIASPIRAILSRARNVTVLDLAQGRAADRHCPTAAAG
jgi:NADH dehydrogenase FAD-containing subunit